MNKYVVACFSYYTNDVEQKAVYANSEFDAVVNFLGSKPPGIHNLEDLLEWVWDQEMMINLIEI